MFFLFTTLAIVSLANRLSAPSTILWLAPASPDAKPFGPYVNATHFAGAMELGVPWMLGYALSRETRSSETQYSGSRSRRSEPRQTSTEPPESFGWYCLRHQ